MASSKKPRTNEAVWVENKSHWRITEQRAGERKEFTDSRPGRRGKLAAERAADEWIEGIDPSKTRLAEVWNRFEATLKAELFDKHGERIPGTSKASYTKHEQIWRLYINPRLGHKLLSRITDQDYDDCVLEAFREHHLYKKSLENIRSTLVALYGFARKNRIPMPRPEGIKIPRGARVREKPILQPDQLRVLFADDSIIHYNRPKRCHFINLWRLEVLIGGRRGELCGLKTADDDGFGLTIRRSINRDQDTTGGKNETSYRYIVTNDLMRSVIDDQKAYLRSVGIVSPWLFPSLDGGQPNSNAAYKAWVAYRTQHGITSSLHGLRRTLISIAKADIPEVLIKRVVGHSAGMDTFGVYGERVDGEDARVSKMLEEVFRRILHP
jgi:integrase